MQIIICDICGTSKNVERESYSYDTRMDGAGSRETVAETFDLCITCKLATLYSWLKKEDDKTGNKFVAAMERNKELIKVIKEKIKK